MICCPLIFDEKEIRDAEADKSPTVDFQSGKENLESGRQEQREPGSYQILFKDWGVAHCLTLRRSVFQRVGIDRNLIRVCSKWVDVLKPPKRGCWRQSGSCDMNLQAKLRLSSMDLKEKSSLNRLTEFRVAIATARLKKGVATDLKL